MQIKLVSQDSIFYQKVVAQTGEIKRCDDFLKQNTLDGLLNIKMSNHPQNTIKARLKWISINILLIED